MKIASCLGGTVVKGNDQAPRTPAFISRLVELLPIGIERACRLYESSCQPSAYMTKAAVMEIPIRSKIPPETCFRVDTSSHSHLIGPCESSAIQSRHGYRLHDLLSCQCLVFEAIRIHIASRPIELDETSSRDPSCALPPGVSATVCSLSLVVTRLLLENHVKFTQVDNIAAEYSLKSIKCA